MLTWSLRDEKESRANSLVRIIGPFGLENLARADCARIQHSKSPEQTGFPSTVKGHPMVLKKSAMSNARMGSFFNAIPRQVQ